MTADARCGQAPIVTNGAGLEMDDRVTLLDWGHYRLVETVDRALKIVSETKDKLEREFERPL